MVGPAQTSMRYLLTIILPLMMPLYGIADKDTYQILYKNIVSLDFLLFLIEIIPQFHSVSFVSYKNNSSSLYDICHYAKQKVTPYTNTVFSSNHIFDLLHVGIWGLMLPILFLVINTFLTLVDK